MLILQIYKGFLSIICFLSCVKFLEIVLFIHLFLLFFGSFHVEESMMFGCRNGFFVVGQIKQTNSHPDGLRTECDRIFVYLIAMDTRKSGRPIDTFEWIEIFDYFFLSVHRFYFNKNTSNRKFVSSTTFVINKPNICK